MICYFEIPIGVILFKRYFIYLQACLFVNISPDAKNFAETCNTLEFGSNARQVALGQAKQNIRKAPDGPWHHQPYKLQDL